MKRIFVCLFILFFATLCVGAQRREGKARTVELTLHPAKAPQPAEKYQLLPKADQQTDADAVPLYQKAVQALPENFSTVRVSQWLKAPLKQLPVAEVQSTLNELKPALQLLQKAARCKKCQWPAVQPGTLPANLPEYHKLAYSLALQVRLQIAQGQYDQAIGTMQTSFAMARHLGESTTLSQGLVGVAIGALTLNQLEQLVQMPDAPDLYLALKELPKPLVDLNKQMKLEIANLKKYKNPVTRIMLRRTLQPAHDHIRLLMKKLDRHVAALQCIEALRLYAAAHDGKFPSNLTEIIEVAVPGDPVTGKPFIYHRTGSKAVLEAPAPETAKPEDAMRYELTLKE